jgi:hypothetical protein
MNQPRRVGTKERAEKHSKNDGVNELIALMREVAVRLVKLGDDFEAAIEAAKLENETLHAQVASMEEQWHFAELHEEQFEDWQELLLNFRSGVVDQGELLEGTVGRR